MQGGGGSGSGVGSSSSSSSSGRGSGSGSGSGGNGGRSSSSGDGSKMPLGISLAGLKAFIDSRAGGRGAFFGLTTEAVKEIHVKPATVDNSYAQMQLEQGSGHVQQANKFVSHTYGYYFLDLVDAVEVWEREQPEGSGPFFYYIDLLCVNQHSSRGPEGVVPFEELRDEFAGSIRSIGHTLLLLKWSDPVPIPVPLTRAWCVFEISTTLSSGVRLEVIMPPSDTEDFMAALDMNFDSIALQDSVASIPQDQENIPRVIRESPGGFLQANKLVTKAVKDWMLARGDARQQSMGSIERGISPLILSLGRLLQDTGKLAEAEAMQREALDTRQRTFRIYLENTLFARYRFFKALMDRVLPGAPMPRGCEAETLLLAVFTDASSLLGESHATTLAVRTDLGMLMIKQNRHQEASELLERHLGVIQGQLGRQHVLALECSTHLAICCSCQGRMGEAEELFTAAHTGFLSSSLHGPDHPRTLSMASNLALLRRKTGQLAGAEEMYQTMLDSMRRVMGEEHKNTRKLLNDIAALRVAMLHAEKGRGGSAAAQGGVALEAALARIRHDHPLQRIKDQFFRYCDVCNENNSDVVLHTCPVCQMAWCQSCFKLGLEHKVLEEVDISENTLHARHTLFQALMDRVPPGVPVPCGCEAEALLLAVLTDASSLLGESHATTLAVRTDLGMLMIKQNRHQEASELLERHLGVIQGQLGRQHVLALECSTHLAICCSCQGRLGEAEVLFTAAYTGFLSSPLHGTDHPRTLSMASNLALCRRKMGKLTGAAEIYQAMLDPMRRVKGEEHENTRKLLNDIATLQVEILQAEKSREGGAAAQGEVALEAALARIGHDHPLQRNSSGKMPLGISLAGLKAFIDSRTGGRGAFFGLTTEAVKEKHVKPATVDNSYAQMQLEQGSGHVQQANKFVSHTYGYYFLDLVDAVEVWEREQPEGSGPFFYYIDLLCVNQHSSRGPEGVVPFEELRDEFAGSIRSIGHTLLLLKWGDPVPIPVPLTRAWCVFEISTTLSSGVRLEVIMPPSDTDDFMSALVNNFDSIALQTCSVKVEESKATISLDQENIHRIIRESPGGFFQANKLIIKAMKDWMLARGMAKLQSMGSRGSSERGLKPLILSLGLLLRDTGETAEAEELHREALDTRERIFRAYLVSIMQARYGLFKTLMGRVPPGAPMPRDCEAETLLLAVHNDANRLLGESHATTLAVRNDLGMLLSKQNRHQEASELLERHLGVIQGQLGRQHVLALECSTHLAICCSFLGRMGEAEALFTAAHTGLLSSPLHGTVHPRTLRTASNLALCRRKLGHLTGADEIYQFMLNSMRSVVGENEASTARIINDMAALRVAMLHAERSRGGGAAAQGEVALEAALARIRHDHPLQRIKERHFRYCDVCNENNSDVVLHTCPVCQKDWCQSCYELGLEHKVLQVSI